MCLSKSKFMGRKEQNLPSKPILKPPQELVKDLCTFAQYFIELVVYWLNLRSQLCVIVKILISSSIQRLVASWDSMTSKTSSCSLGEDIPVESIGVCLLCWLSPDYFEQAEKLWEILLKHSRSMNLAKFEFHFAFLGLFTCHRYFLSWHVM